MPFSRQALATAAEPVARDEPYLRRIVDIRSSALAAPAAPRAPAGSAPARTPAGDSLNEVTT